MTSNENGFAFTFNGKLFIPREDAKDFYSKGTNSGKIHLTYKNWFINVFNGTTRSNYYVLFLAMKLRFKEFDYELKGNFQFPQFVLESPEYNEFIREFNLKNVKTPTDGKSKKNPSLSKNENATKNKCGDGYCKGNRICIEGKCVDPDDNVTFPQQNIGGCNGPGDCKGNRICNDGKCVEPEATNPRLIKGCIGPDDCKNGRVCKDGVCVDIDDGIFELTPTP
jgi:hypothetical protein